LIDQVLGGCEKRGEAETQAQKDFHADESTGKGRFGKCFAADLRGWTLIGNRPRISSEQYQLAISK